MERSQLGSDRHPELLSSFLGSRTHPELSDSHQPFSEGREDNTKMVLVGELKYHHSLWVLPRPRVTDSLHPHWLHLTIGKIKHFSGFIKLF